MGTKYDFLREGGGGGNDVKKNLHPVSHGPLTKFRTSVPVVKRSVRVEKKSLIFLWKRHLSDDKNDKKSIKRRRHTYRDYSFL